jgi:hypothetical protein
MIYIIYFYDFFVFFGIILKWNDQTPDGSTHDS